MKSESESERERERGSVVQGFRGSGVRRASMRHAARRGATMESNSAYETYASESLRLVEPS